MRTVFAETAGGRRSAVYRPGQGWAGNVRRRSGRFTRSAIVISVIAVCVLLIVVMSNSQQP